MSWWCTSCSTVPPPPWDPHTVSIRGSATCKQSQTVDRVVCLFNLLEICSPKLRTAPLTLTTTHFSAVILRSSAGCFSFLFYYFFIQTGCSELLSHVLVRALWLAETQSWIEVKLLAKTCVHVCQLERFNDERVLTAGVLKPPCDSLPDDMCVAAAGFV